MTNLAEINERRIKSLNGIAGTGITILTFTDGSHAQFNLEPGTVGMQSTGSNTSFARAFAGKVKHIATIEDGFEVVFQDDSKLSRDLKGRVTSSTI